MKKWVVLAVAMMMVAGAQAKEKGKAKHGDTAITKAAFIEKQKKIAESAGVAFDQAKVEAAFAAQDKNGDGVLTADEQTPAKGKHKGKKK